MDCWKAKLLDKLVLKVLDVALFSTNLEGLLLRSLEVFLLADSGHEADHIVVLLNEPGKDAGGVQATAVSKADTLLLRHIGEDVEVGLVGGVRSVCFSSRVSREVLVSFAG